MNFADFRRQYPDVFFLDPVDPVALDGYLRQHGLLTADEKVISVTKAGEGNMNCTVRVITDRQRLIVKQARPWIEKYPQFAAPWDRACREIEFYERAGSVPAVASAMPRLWLGDREARVLVLEDLGTLGDYSTLYQGGRLAASELMALAGFLSELHAAFLDTSGRSALPNREMRALNYAHIFAIPLESDNGLDLEAIQPGLRKGAEALRGDERYRIEVRRLGKQGYLADGPCLLHGDFFPGSLIKTPAGPRVIDPEFCYFGRPEYDVAVFLAHLLMAQQPASTWSEWRHGYRPAGAFDETLVLQLAGVEVMRRLIGYAQLPLRLSPAGRRSLLELSRALVCEPSWPKLDAWSFPP